jgi:exonuclease SbcD
LSTGALSRTEEHVLFLRWLTETLAARQVDVLIVAGDVFDTMQPSAEALGTYYRFLSGLGETGVRDVVIVGGNHDSPSRLDAPRELLEGLNIHVAGGVRTRDSELGELIVPLRSRGSDELVGVCLAVPYIHEYRLGIRTTDRDRKAVQTAFESHFGALYTRLADLAERSYPGLPLVATGHLTMGPVSRQDYPHQIHQVGFIDSLPSTVLDPRLCYVALGHIHRAFAVEQGRVWYSGSPVATSVLESDASRQILLVDIEPAAQVKVTPVFVPCSRELLRVEGTLHEVVAALSTLDSPAPLPPLVHVVVELDAPAPALRPKIFAAVESLAVERRPLIVDIRTSYVGAELCEPGTATPTLDELSPAEVLSRLCAARGVTDVAAIELAFQQLSSATDEDFEQMVRDAHKTEVAS